MLIISTTLYRQLGACAAALPLRVDGIINCYELCAMYCPILGWSDTGLADSGGVSSDPSVKTMSKGSVIVVWDFCYALSRLVSTSTCSKLLAARVPLVLGQ